MSLWTRISDVLGLTGDVSDADGPDGADDADDAGGTSGTPSARTEPQTATGTPSRAETTEGSFRADVQGVFTIDGVGTVVSARVEQGRLVPGDAVEVEPGTAAGTVETIERHHEEVEAAEPGDHVGLAIDGLDAADVDEDCRLYAVDR